MVLPPLSVVTVLVLPEATVLPEAMFLPPFLAVAALPLVPTLADGLVVLVLLIDVVCVLLSVLPLSLVTATPPLLAAGLPSPVVLSDVDLVLVLVVVLSEFLVLLEPNV